MLLIICLYFCFFILCTLRYIYKKNKKQKKKVICELWECNEEALVFQLNDMLLRFFILLMFLLTLYM